MAKITRPDLNVLAFGSSSTGTSRTIFGSATQSDILTDNLSTEYFQGWDTLGVKPPRQWVNGALYTCSQLVSYLFQVGIAEWNTNQEYHTNSISIGSNGNIYQSNTDNNTGNDPLSDTVNWTSFMDKYSLNIDGLTEKTTPVDADLFVLADSVDSFSNKKLTLSNLKSAIGGSLPSVTGTLTTNAVTNNIELTGIGNLNGLSIGDVIQITDSTSNNTEFTYEIPVDSDNIIVNQAHANQGTSKNLIAESGTANVTIKILSKYYNAPIGLGQGWADVTSIRAFGATYPNNTNRSIQTSIDATATGTVAIFSVFADGNRVGYKRGYYQAATQEDGGGNIIIPKDSDYRVDSSGYTLLKFSELR